jgi:hypothetical protein
VLDLWKPDIAAAESGARDPDARLSRLIERRTSILAASEGHLTAVESNGLTARLRSEIDLTMGAVEASMLVSDWSLLEEFLSWQMLALESQGLQGQEHIVESLAVALGPFDSDASQRLVSAAKS